MRIETDDGELDEYALQKFVRSNQGTCINQRPIVDVGQRVEAGQAIADSSSTDRGELALGTQHPGGVHELGGWQLRGRDRHQRAARPRRHVHLASTSRSTRSESRDTKLGPEEITRDIPNVGEEALKDLDEEGIVRIGAEVRPGDILVGKITPKGETELTAEERLLRAIFGEKAREVKDTSLRLPHGEQGKVVEIREFRRERNDDLPPGVNQPGPRVSVAQKRKITRRRQDGRPPRQQGRDRARSCPQEDMPYLPDGTPVDIILNPLGVPSRMNIGQILETHLGWARPGAGLQGGHAGLRRRDRGADPAASSSRRACPRTARSCCTTAGPASRSTSDDRRLYLHAQAAPPGGGQDPRPITGPY